jgi:hypothetical protein
MTSQRTAASNILEFTAFFITLLVVSIALSATATAQNPVPFIDQPLVPDATAPGGAGFTLRVNGSGFVAASLVNWNGSPRSTTFVSSTQLTAIILASDISTASTAAVTVVNPTTGGVSDTQFFSIAVAETSVSFAPAVTYSSGGSGGIGPGSLVVADVNGDGIPDIIVGNSGGTISSVGVLLGNGDGTFQPALPTYIGGSLVEFSSVAVADVNRDGTPDLVVATCCESNGEGEAAVLLGNGDGTFQAPLFYDAGGNASALVVTDVNGDGNPDIVFTNYNDADNSTVSVLLGNGNGTFQPALISAAPDDAGTLIIADVNGDGKPDALIYTNTISVLLGNGDGTFQPATYYEGGYCSSLAVGDVNGDGIPDLVTANSGLESCGLNAQGFAGILLGNGNGTFQPVVNYLAINNTGIGVGDVALADVNGDNNLDVMVTSGLAPVDLGGATFGTVGVLLGNGNGTLQTAVPFQTGGGGTQEVVSADLNDDGRPDIVVANWDPYAVGVMLNSTGSAEPSATTLTSSLNPSNFGQTVTLTAAVTSSSGTPAGTVTFYDDTTVTTLGSATLVSGSASISLSSLAAGSQSITAVYRSSSTFASSTSAALTQVVNGVATATTLASSPNPSIYGQTATFTATVTSPSGTPTGTVVFYDTSTATTLGSATLVSGSASFSFSWLAAGSQSITAAYRGSGAFAPSTSAVLNQVVNPATTTTALSSSLNPAVFGQSFTFTAAVSSTAGTPTGIVYFYDNSATIAAWPLADGSASISLSSLLTTGSQTITSAYQGSTTFSGSTSAPLNQVVNPATTTTSLTSSANPATPGKRITYTATVTSQYGGAATGTVTFQDGGVTIATVALSSNQAHFSTTYPTAAVHSITATYPGDANNGGSTSATLTETIDDPSDTALATSGSPSFFGELVTFTATVTSAYGAIPNGELVTFYEGSTDIGTGTTSNGTATFTTSSLSVKTHTIKATYAGDTTFKTSSGTVTQVVDKATTTTALVSSQNPSGYEQSVTFTATVSPQFSGTPTGSVTFYNGTAVLGTETLVDGVAAYTTTKLAVGTGSITAEYYKGSSSFDTSTSSVLSQVVNQASTTTTLVSSVNPSNSGQSVTFTATVAGQFGGRVTGSVTFMDGTTTLKTVNLSGGLAKYTTTTLAAGTHDITATYDGSTDFSTSSASLTQTVN